MCGQTMGMCHGFVTDADDTRNRMCHEL